MAKIDIINIRGNKERCVNLSHSVGIGGKNHPADVMLIQALFYYLCLDKEAKLKGTIIPNPALAAVTDFPITGLLNVLTFQTIFYFQSTHRHRLLSADAVIHPADYEGRVVKDSNKPLMTITYLHLLGKKRELETGGDYIAAVRKIINLFFAFEFIWAVRRIKH